MGRKSTIDLLPGPIHDEVKRMLGSGRWTIAQIVAHLQEAGHPVSKSAVGRVKIQVDRVAERLRQSRQVTDALVAELGDATAQGKQGRLLVEMARALVFDLLMKIQGGETEIDTKDVQQLGKGLAELGRALRLDQDFETKVREQANKKAAVTAVEAALEAGLSDEAAAAIQRKILGLRE